MKGGGREPREEGYFDIREEAEEEREETAEMALEDGTEARLRLALVEREEVDLEEGREGLPGGGLELVEEERGGGA